MNIKSNGTVNVLAKNERDGQNGQKFYNLAIIIDGEAGNISCTEEAYENAVVGELNGVVYAYNEQYKSFRIVNVVPSSSVLDYSQSGAKPDTKPDSKSDKPSGK